MRKRRFVSHTAWLLPGTQPLLLGRGRPWIGLQTFTSTTQWTRHRLCVVCGRGPGGAPRLCERAPWAQLGVAAWLRGTRTGETQTKPMRLPKEGAGDADTRRGGRPREAADRRGPRGGCLAGPMRSLHRVFDRTRGLVRPWRRGAHEEGRDVMMSACDPCLGGEDDDGRGGMPQKRKESPCPLLSPCSQRSLPEGLCCERRKRGDRSTCVSHSAIALLLSRKNRRPNETIRARFYQQKIGWNGKHQR